MNIRNEIMALLFAACVAGCATKSERIPAKEQKAEPPAAAATKTPDAAEIERLVGLLGDEDYQKREEAQNRLRETGRPAIRQLRAATKTENVEQRMRASEILADIGIFKAWPFDEAEAKKRQKEAAELLDVPVEKEVALGDGVKMKFALIPAGEFVMGSSETEKDRGDGEGPAHKVTIKKAFYIGVTEVTQAQWKALMGGSNPSQYKGDDMPVERVAWDGCRGYLKLLSEKEKKIFRLPTEAEWEYACRAGSAMRYSGGDDDNAPDEAGWHTENSGGTTHPVAQKKPNAWGLYDMHGNVWEWCQDFYGEYKDGDQVDPTGVEMGMGRVMRGGSWLDAAKDCRSAKRYFFLADISVVNSGFRTVMETGAGKP
jgi:formylglycine-generating enzyme required for sulfatase activity